MAPQVTAASRSCTSRSSSCRRATGHWRLARLGSIALLCSGALALNVPLKEDLPSALKGIDWDGSEDELAVMTSSWRAGTNLGRRAPQAVASVNPSTSAAAGVSSTVPAASSEVGGAGATAAPVASSSAMDSSNSVAAETTSQVSVVATTTVTRTASATSAIPTSTAVPAGYTLPEAFDSTLGNFTGTACPSFFKTFLADPAFVNCAPFSLLLATSAGFFTAERAPYSLLPFVLDASCSASNDTCSALMSQLAGQIRLPNTCGPDLARGQPLVTEALMGFQNYNLYREAGCQKSNSTGRYCFAEASAQSDPDELYFYYLPEGTSLPSGTTTGCEPCTQGLLQIYAKYATNSTLAISKTYTAGRSLANQVCGPIFAPAISTTTTSTASSSSEASLLLSLGALVLGLTVLR